jgi:hypothetical protein
VVVVEVGGGLPAFIEDDDKAATFETLGEARRLMRRHILASRVIWYLDLSTGQTEGPP